MNINPMELVKQMGAFQEKLAAITAEGSSGGGMVAIGLNGKFEVTSVKIAPEAIADGDTGMLEDLVQAAFSDGLEKIREAMGSEMGSMAGGLMPNGFNFSDLSGLMGNT